MSLVHYAAKPVTDVYAVEQPVIQPRDFGPKPKGLWVSDEDDYGWSQWCIDEDFGMERLAVAHEVTLADDGRVLLVRNSEELDAFTEIYGHPRPTLGQYWVDWPAVAREFQGIVITPYIYSRRMTNHTSWYYPWDCASGCIWDPAAIASIRVISQAMAS